jgi:hypothetical protein
MSKQKSGIPKSWHIVASATGETLYYRREHTGYEVHPQGSGDYRCELDGEQIGMARHLTAAIVLCRDHMHETGRYPGSTNAANAAGA